jgi:hypothetical protein
MRYPRIVGTASACPRGQASTRSRSSTCARAVPSLWNCHVLPFRKMMAVLSFAAIACRSPACRKERDEAEWQGGMAVAPRPVPPGRQGLRLAVGLRFVLPRLYYRAVFSCCIIPYAHSLGNPYIDASREVQTDSATLRIAAPGRAAEPME